MPRARQRFRRLQPESRAKHLTGLDAIRAISPQLAKPLERAIAALKANDLVAALFAFGKCAEIDPTNKAVLYFGSDAVQRAYFNLKHADPSAPPEQLARWHEAAFTLTSACYEVDPTDPVACHNVGRFVQDDGDDQGSVAWYQKALSMKREQVESWGNLGTALYSLGETMEAERCWSKCVAFDATNPSGALAQSYVWIRRGDYARGWAALNHRWSDPTFSGTYGRPDLLGKPWTGQPLRARESVLLHGEQGLGDHVMFARYVTLAAEHVRIAGLETRAPLKRWMEQALPGIPVFARDQDKLPGYTHHCPLMSLPGILGTQEIPNPAAPCVNVKRATSGTNRRIGLVWYGTTGNPADFQRSIQPECLRELANIPGVTWVPLQYDPSGTADLTARAWLGARVELTQYANALELAEVMAGLDLVVSVDTLAAHVAGSIGVPTILLHRFNREWRWGQHSESTDWYPSVVQMTQSKPGDWRELLQRVRSRIIQLGKGSDVATEMSPAA